MLPLTPLISPTRVATITPPSQSPGTVVINILDDDSEEEIIATTLTTPSLAVIPFFKALSHPSARKNLFAFLDESSLNHLKRVSKVTNQLFRNLRRTGYWERDDFTFPTKPKQMLMHFRRISMLSETNANYQMTKEGEAAYNHILNNVEIYPESRWNLEEENASIRRSTNCKKKTSMVVGGFAFVASAVAAVYTASQPTSDNSSNISTSFAMMLVAVTCALGVDRLNSYFNAGVQTRIDKLEKTMEIMRTHVMVPEIEKAFTTSAFELIRLYYFACVQEGTPCDPSDLGTDDLPRKELHSPKTIMSTHEIVQLCNDLVGKPATSMQTIHRCLEKVGAHNPKYDQDVAEYTSQAEATGNQKERDLLQKIVAHAKNLKSTEIQGWYTPLLHCALHIIGHHKVALLARQKAALTQQQKTFSQQGSALLAQQRSDLFARQKAALALQEEKLSKRETSLLAKLVEIFLHPLPSGDSARRIGVGGNGPRRNSGQFTAAQMQQGLDDWETPSPAQTPRQTPVKPEDLALNIIDTPSPTAHIENLHGNLRTYFTEFKAAKASRDTACKQSHAALISYLRKIDTAVRSGQKLNLTRVITALKDNRLQSVMMKGLEDRLNQAQADLRAFLNHGTEQRDSMPNMVRTSSSAQSMFFTRADAPQDGKKASGPSSRRVNPSQNPESPTSNNTDRSILNYLQSSSPSSSSSSSSSSTPPIATKYRAVPTTAEDQPATPPTTKTRIARLQLQLHAESSSPIPDESESPPALITPQPRTSLSKPIPVRTTPGNSSSQPGVVIKRKASTNDASSPPAVTIRRKNTPEQGVSPVANQVLGKKRAPIQSFRPEKPAVG